MSTEDINPRFLEIDTWDNLAILEALHEGQLSAVACVGPTLSAIAAAVDAAAKRLQAGGRLIYVGAGTSGRIAVQDGAELGPTFGWTRTEFLMAGGEGAFLHAVEGAEDSADAARKSLEHIGVGANDVVIGVAASGRTPFTVGAIQAAHERGAMTIGVANNSETPLLQASSHPILLDTGPEPIAGSTRLQAATAQKVTLNLFSTALMIRLGRVHAGMMVSMKPTNEKLRRRAVQMVSAVAGCDESAAAAALAQADGDIKLASLIAVGMDRAQAQELLHRRGGSLRDALWEHAQT